MRDCDKQSERPRRWTVSWVQYALTGMIVVSLVSASSAAWAETPGERFRKVMEREAEYCATHKIKPTNRRCDITKLQPADPLTTEEGWFAHSIKIPHPVPEDSGYKPGMTPQEYFNHLCKMEAGEFIYKIIDDVEGIYMMRPREHASDKLQEHLYAMEDPYGYMDAEAQDAEFFFVSPNRYKFLEMPLSRSRRPSWGKQFLDASYFFNADSNTRYERYWGSNGRDPKTMVKEYDSVLKSRYGYTWRGIIRPHDRELGIAGSELIVLDLKTKEVLGVRRGYIKTGNVRNNSTGVWWLTGQACPSYGLRGGRDRDFDFAYWFIGKVIKPLNYELSFKELSNVK
jgi:hypothetical protein